MPEYRPLSDDERDVFQEMVQYAFRIQEGPWSPDSDDEDEPRIGESYGYVVDDAVASVCRHYHWTTWIRGTSHPLVGLSAVATPPEHRRQGYVREMLRCALQEYREDGTYLSVLWPFEHPFYRRLGWGTAFHGFSHRCAPDALSQFRDPDDRWLRLHADDWERLDPVHDAHGAHFELTIEREEAWWRERIFEGWHQDPFVYGFERDGDIAAYIAYVADEDDDETVLRPRDVAWVDQDAREAVYGFLARHESQVERVQLWSTDDDLLWQVDDPADIETERHAAAMFRLVDAPVAIEALQYPPALDVTFDLAVEDPLADWNDGRFSVRVEDGSARVETSSGVADATLRIDALSQLFVGARDVEFLVRTDQLATNDETASALDAMFPASRVLLREGF